MKKTILLMMATVPTFLYAQQKFVIKGKVGSINPPSRVFLIYDIDNKGVADSTTIRNGVFEFSGQVNDITLAELVMDYKGTGLSINGNPEVQTLYLEQGMITVSSADSLSKARIGGTKANEDYERYLAAIKKPVIDAARALSIEYNSAPIAKRNSKEFVGIIQKKEQAIQQQKNDIQNQFIADNPNAYTSLQIIIDKLKTDQYPDSKTLQTQFSKLSKNLRESLSGVACQKRLNELKIVAVGALAPDFEQPDTNGKLIRLSSFRGKYVLVDFWASWCVPCRKQNPNLVKVYQNFKRKNFTILGVSIDQPERKEDWLKAIHTDGLEWAQVSLKSLDSGTATQYDVRVIPQNLLIAPDGKIIAKNIFGDDLEKKLNEVLGKG
ncbi:MAG: redoxin domain-containing protein [Mucilaginibacter sp.]